MADWRESIEQDILDKLGLRLEDLVNGSVEVNLASLSTGIGGSLQKQLDRIELLELQNQALIRQNQVLLRLIIFYLPRFPVAFRVSVQSGPNMPVAFVVDVHTISGPPVGFQIEESQ